MGRPAMNLAYDDARHFLCNDLRRWKLEAGRLFSVRLHHWVAGDPEEYQHMHPWNFLTIVLWGGYDDVVRCEGDHHWPGVTTGVCPVCMNTRIRLQDRVRAPAVRYRPMTWRHSVINCRPGTWSIVITGRVLGAWRFFIKEREVDQQEWKERPC